MPGCQKSEKNSLQIKQKKDWIKPETLIKKSKRELDTQNDLCLTGVPARLQPSEWDTVLAEALSET